MLVDRGLVFEDAGDKLNRTEDCTDAHLQGMLRVSQVRSNLTSRRVNCIGPT